MMKIKHVILFAVLFVLVGATGAFAQLVVTGEPPKFGGANAGTFQPALDIAWNEAISEINKEIGSIDAKPEKLIKGFADASVFASQGATQRGYGEPKLFTFTIGSIVGVKIGSSLTDAVDYFDTIADEIKREGDVTLGANVQAISGQFNLNTSRFLLDGLDLGIRFGIFKLGDDVLENFSFDTLSFGVVGNYQLIKEKTLVPILVKWRGLSLGTGFIYQSTKLSYSMDIDGVDPVKLGGSYTNTTLHVDPKLVFDMTTSTFTIPLEASTAIQLFSFLNITLGAGVDLAFGSNEMTLGVTSDVNVDGLPSGVTQTASGSLAVTGGGKMKPSFFNPKLMTGVGFKIGPIIIDVPVSLYFGDGSGASAGVTLGFTL